MSEIIKKLRGTPTNLLEAVHVAFGSYPAGPIANLPEHVALHIKDYAAQKFQAAILRAGEEESLRLAALFQTIFGLPYKTDQADLKMWVIYFNPKDYPQQHIARLHTARTGATDQVETGSLDELREKFDHMGLSNIGRFQNDDPCIVEVWI